jgi:Skp family chaperone for outer membrane proteins
MGNNNLMITEMFEEIKSLLVSIEKKLDNEASKSSSANPDIERRPQNAQPKVDLQKLEQIFKAIYAYLQNSDNKTSETNQRIGDSEKQILSRLQEIKYSIETQEKERIVRHQHSVDLKSSKVVVSIIALAVLFLISLIGNIKQSETNSRMADNDLKYRYIKSINGISREGLKKLEDIFEYYRDQSEIRKIRQKVKEYEKKLDAAAKDLIEK